MTQPEASRAAELLAPGGDRLCIRAAIENGADAVYFGLQSGFNARARATNFSAEELPELMAELHGRGVKGYLTLNTLVFSAELAEAERLVRHAVASGVDAVLVQDLGLARLARAICPDLPLHASTQMSLTSAGGIRAAESLGISRVVLARELSLEEIRRLKAETRVELEVFVHGALCISYSGQCLASLAMGGRSGNRGQCAQPCRMPYGLKCDGEPVPLGDARYLLSPLDLAAYELLGELMDAGVQAFKIEGRLKGPEYVAAATRHYRAAIDQALAGQRPSLAPAERQELELSFSRGFSTGWLEGPNFKRLVPGTSSANRGVYLGTVRRVQAGRVEVELAGPVKRGDGLVFEPERADQAEQGGRVYEVFRDGESLTRPIAEGVVELTFGRKAIDVRALRPGLKVWKTDDAAQDRRLRQTYDRPRPQRRLAVDLVVEAAVGQSLRVAARAASGATCRMESEQTLAEAVQHPLTAEVLREQLGRLGGSAYELRHLDARIEGRPMAPLSLLGKLRREMLAQLQAAAAALPERTVAEGPVLPGLRRAAAGRAGQGATESPQWHVLCRRLDQVEAVLRWGARSVIADLSDLDEVGQAVESARRQGAAVWLATPRIQKPGEEPLLERLADLRPDGVLARNLASLARLVERGLPAAADFSLHAANELTAEVLLAMGACRVTAAYDLDRPQVLELAGAVPAGRLEVVVHRNTPLVHTAYCLYCARLSPGSRREDCGTPCRRHGLTLVDRLGQEHPVVADACCRNTVFHGRAQSMTDGVGPLLRRGVRHFRIELLDQTPGRQLDRLLGRLASIT